MAANTPHIGQKIILASGDVGTITKYDADTDVWRVTLYHPAGSPLAGKPRDHVNMRHRDIVKRLRVRNVFRVVRQGKPFEPFFSTASADAYLTAHGFSLDRVVTPTLAVYRRDTECVSLWKVSV